MLKPKEYEEERQIHATRKDIQIIKLYENLNLK